jgi:hypothetical protein
VNKLTIEDGDAFVIAHPNPDVGFLPACGEVDAQPSVLEGHFGDDGAWECEATIPDGEEPDDLYIVTKHWCEVTLVIDRLTPQPVQSASPPPG